MNIIEILKTELQDNDPNNPILDRLDEHTSCLSDVLKHKINQDLLAALRILVDSSRIDKKKAYSIAVNILDTKPEILEDIALIKKLTKKLDENGATRIITYYGIYSDKELPDNFKTMLLTKADVIKIFERGVRLNKEQRKMMSFTVFPREAETMLRYSWQFFNMEQRKLLKNIADRNIGLAMTSMIIGIIITGIFLFYNNSIQISIAVPILLVISGHVFTKRKTIRNFGYSLYGIYMTLGIILAGLLTPLVALKIAVTGEFVRAALLMLFFFAVLYVSRQKLN
ncbi:MAG: hypothetical protein J7J93_01110 [Candidatus Aenigmarchaeota archaeon]|nr:hypothetical protein [Candidatus Aenigmarchaeota archaeon]